MSKSDLGIRTHTGIGNLTITSQIVWAGGYMNGNGGTWIASGARLYLFGLVTMNRLLNVDPAAQVGWLGNGAVLRSHNGVIYANNKDEAGLEPPTNDGPINLNGIRMFAGIGNVQLLVSELRAIMTGQSSTTTKEQLWTFFQNMPAIFRADIAEAYYRRMGVELTNALASSQVGLSRNAAQRAISQLYNGDSADLPADTRSGLRQAWDGTVSFLGEVVGAFNISAANARVENEMGMYLSNGTGEYSAVILSVFNNHPLFGSGLIGGFEAYHGISLRAEDMGQQLSTGQRWLRAGMFALDVVAVSSIVSVGAGVPQIIRGSGAALSAGRRTVGGFTEVIKPMTSIWNYGSTEKRHRIDPSLLQFATSYALGTSL